MAGLQMGYDAEWGVFSAAAVGAPTKRDRMWIVAYSDPHRLQRINAFAGAASIDEREWADIKRVVGQIQQREGNSIPESWVVRKGSEMADRVDRTKALGNGQVPQCAAEAFRRLMGR